MSSSGSSTKTLSDTMFPFPMISSGAQLGVIGTVSHVGFIFYFGADEAVKMIDWAAIGKENPFTDKG